MSEAVREPNAVEIKGIVLAVSRRNAQSQSVVLADMEQKGLAWSGSSRKVRTGLGRRDY
jgi:hypothetical protein